MDKKNNMKITKELMKSLPALKGFAGWIEKFAKLYPDGATIDEIVNNKNDNFSIPILLTTRADITQAFVDAGVDVTYNNSGAMFEAMYHCDYDVIKILLENGIDVNYDDGYPLGEAIDNKCADIVKLLLNHGADRYKKNGRFLWKAVIQGDDEIVQLLLDDENGKYSEDVLSLLL